MITEKDLEEAIKECEGKRKPDANTCMKLAAFYTIKDQLYPQKVASGRAEPEPKFEENYSYSAGPDIQYSGQSEFANAVYGRDPNDIMPIMDELMETIKVLNPRLYSGVMRRLR